ncbi:MAG: hypothetical protein HKM24_04825 [Gammaproteobacteria bacterium]|nr:hypothetical protein [Gammaproteobacteria bacterium]
MFHHRKAGTKALVKSMGYLHINTMGNNEDEDNAFIKKRLPMGLKARYSSCGRSAAKIFPKDVKLPLCDDYSGVKKTGLLGNVNNYLIMNSKATEMIVDAMPADQIEVYSFTILDRNGDIFSKDYKIVNPLGGFDCLHMTKSKINHMDNGKILSIDEYVLDESKLKNAPPLFRIQESLSEYVMSSKLFDALLAAGVDNLHGTPFKVSGV